MDRGAAVGRDFCVETKGNVKISDFGLRIAERDLEERRGRACVVVALLRRASLAPCHPPLLTLRAARSSFSTVS